MGKIMTRMGDGFPVEMSESQLMGQHITLVGLVAR